MPGGSLNAQVLTGENRRSKIFPIPREPEMYYLIE